MFDFCTILPEIKFLPRCATVVHHRPTCGHYVCVWAKSWGCVYIYMNVSNYVYNDFCDFKRLYLKSE